MVKNQEISIIPLFVNMGERVKLSPTLLLPPTPNILVDKNKYSDSANKY